MSQLSNHQSLFFAYFSLRNDMVHKNRSRRFERNQPLEVLEGLPQYLQNDLRSWVWPPPRIPVTTRLTLQFFNRESRTKPFFVTIASWGATPKLEVPSTQILGWDPFLLPMHKASHTHTTISGAIFGDAFVTYKADFVHNPLPSVKTYSYILLYQSTNI